jgi:hypothetical protein
LKHCFEGPRARRPGIAADGQVEAGANPKEIRLVRAAFIGTASDDDALLQVRAFFEHHGCVVSVAAAPYCVSKDLTHLFYGSAAAAAKTQAAAASAASAAVSNVEAPAQGALINLPSRSPSPSSSSSEASIEHWGLEPANTNTLNREHGSSDEEVEDKPRPVTSGIDRFVLGLFSILLRKYEQGVWGSRMSSTRG